MTKPMLTGHAVGSQRRIEDVLMMHSRIIDPNNPGYGNCRCGFVVDLPQDQAGHVAALVRAALELTQEKIDAFLRPTEDGGLEDTGELPVRRWVSGWETCNRQPLPPNLKT